VCRLLCRYDFKSAVNSALLLQILQSAYSNQHNSAVPFLKVPDGSVLNFFYMNSYHNLVGNFRQVCSAIVIEAVCICGAVAMLSESVLLPCLS